MTVHVVVAVAIALGTLGAGTPVAGAEGGPSARSAAGRASRPRASFRGALAGMRQGALDLIDARVREPRFPGLVRTMAWGTAAAFSAAYGAPPDQWPVLHPIASFFIELGQHLPNLLPPPDFPEQHVGAAFMTGATVRAAKNLIVGGVRGATQPAPQR